MIMMGVFSVWHWLLLFLLTLFVPLLGMALLGWQHKVLMRHSASGLIKSGYYGWSWTYQLFGWFVPVIRGEIAIGLLHLILTLLTFGLFQVIMACLYNKQYMTRMLTSGWQLFGSDAELMRARRRLGIAG